MPVIVSNCYFTDNIARSNGSHSGALYAYGSNGGVIISESYFSDNVAGPVSGHGRAVFIKGASTPPSSYHYRDILATNQFPNITCTISGNTSAYNIASGGGGGAIYSGVRYGSISLTKIVSVTTQMPTVEQYKSVNLIFTIVPVLSEIFSLTTEPQDKLLEKMEEVVCVLVKPLPHFRTIHSATTRQQEMLEC